LLAERRALAAPPLPRRPAVTSPGLQSCHRTLQNASLGTAARGRRDRSTDQLYFTGPSLAFMHSKGLTLGRGKTLSKLMNFHSFTSVLGHGTTA